MKRILLTTLLLLFAASASAQKGSVKAMLVDQETGEGIPGAVLEVAPVTAPEKKQYFTSGYNGAISIPSLPYGEYSFKASFLGYGNVDTTFKLTVAKLDLGRFETR